MSASPMAALSGALVVEIAGERVWLLPQHAAYWERKRTLLVADAHIGKAATFRAVGIPVPRGTTRGTLDRLSSAIAATSAARVVFLGDLLHAREGRDVRTLETLVEWRRSWAGVEMVLVRGNHDRGAGDPPPEADIGCVSPPLWADPLLFSHHPHADVRGHVIAGHLHPAAVLLGTARQRERLPCFWLRADVSVLPAFGDFTGVAEIAGAEGDRVYGIAEGKVLALAP